MTVELSCTTIGGTNSPQLGGFSSPQATKSQRSALLLVFHPRLRVGFCLVLYILLQVASIANVTSVLLSGSSDTTSVKVVLNCVESCSLSHFVRCDFSTRKDAQSWAALWPATALTTRWCATSCPRSRSTWRPPPC